MSKPLIAQTPYESISLDWWKPLEVGPPFVRAIVAVMIARGWRRSWLRYSASRWLEVIRETAPPELVEQLPRNPVHLARAFNVHREALRRLGFIIRRVKGSRTGRTWIVAYKPHFRRISPRKIPTYLAARPGHPAAPRHQFLVSPYLYLLTCDYAHERRLYRKQKQLYQEGKRKRPPQRFWGH